MINALVLMLAVGLTTAAAWIVSSRVATNNVLIMAEEELAPAAAKDVIEELLVNPDTAHLMKQVVRDYAQGRRYAMGSAKIENKKIAGITDGIFDETPDYGPFVVDSAMEELKNWEEYVRPTQPLKIDMVWMKETPDGKMVFLSDEDYQNLRARHGLAPMPPDEFREEVDKDGNPITDATSK